MDRFLSCGVTANLRIVCTRPRYNCPAASTALHATGPIDPPGLAGPDHAIAKCQHSKITIHVSIL